MHRSLSSSILDELAKEIKPYDIQNADELLVINSLAENRSDFDVSAPSEQRRRHRIPSSFLAAVGVDSDDRAAYRLAFGSLFVFIKLAR